MPTQPNIVGAFHVSTHCIRIDFDVAMANIDFSLRGPVNYEVTGGSPPYVNPDRVLTPTATSQDWFYAYNGGLVKSVYIIYDNFDLHSAGITGIWVANSGPTYPKSLYEGLYLDVNTWAVTTYETYPTTYWSDNGLRYSQVFDELSLTGKAKYTTAQPTNFGIASMLGKIADVVSGAALGELNADIVGQVSPAEVKDVRFGGSGFSLPKTEVPGVGDTISFGGNGIINHVDKLWGPCDGTNDLFRSSIAYHPFKCSVILVQPSLSSASSRVLESEEWYAPSSGDDRLLRLVEAPLRGATLIAVYAPKHSIVRIDREIIAYVESDLSTNTATIGGRAQLMSEIDEHKSGTIVEDVWAASFVHRAELNLYAFGASGKALEYVARDGGVPRGDNPTLDDTELRRALFNTAVALRTTIGTFEQALRYIYPDLYPYITWNEDPRWPGCITIFYNSSEPIQDLNDLQPVPPIELWETWLDHTSWVDGFEVELLYDTYYRDPITDVSYEGDHYLENDTDRPDYWAYPIVLAGPNVSIMGTVSPLIPPPYTVDSSYKNYITRPKGLDRAIAAGVGVLLLDTARL